MATKQTTITLRYNHDCGWSPELLADARHINSWGIPPDNGAIDDPSSHIGWWLDRSLHSMIYEAQLRNICLIFDPRRHEGFDAYLRR